MGLGGPSRSLAFPGWKPEPGAVRIQLLVLCFSLLQLPLFMPTREASSPVVPGPSLPLRQEPVPAASPCLAQNPGPHSQTSSLPSLQKQGLAYQWGIPFFTWLMDAENKLIKYFSLREPNKQTCGFNFSPELYEWGCGIA